MKYNEIAANFQFIVGNCGGVFENFRIFDKIAKMCWII